MKTTIKLLLLGTIAGVMLTAFGQAPLPTFTSVADQAGVNIPGNYTGFAWGDFNNDGLLDLFVANYEDARNVLYSNNGNGTFTSIDVGDLVNLSGYYAGAAWGDFDNDGFLDLAVASPGLGAPNPAASFLYRNNGDNTFSRVSSSVLVRETGRFIAPAWADYDNDGWLDLAITDPGSKNHLYHNNGDGTFTKVTSGPVANDLGFSVAAVWGDYDNDGLPDLFVANLTDNNLSFLYHNNGNGSFSRVTTGPVATDHGRASSGAWGDYNNDGFLDLFVCSDADPNNRLYRNNGDGTFTRVTSGPMLIIPSGQAASGASWGDFDNDGYLDLFITYQGGTNILFHNNGDGTFSPVAPDVSAQGEASDNFCGGWVDYNNDGFLDLFVTRGIAGAAESCVLYQNSGNSNHWIKVRCVGTVSNRSAIGAKVRMRATIAGQTFWQMREINGGDGGLDAVPLLAHFGLGDATNALLLRIEWPSGTVQEFRDIPGNQTLTIVEPPRLSAPVLAGGASFQFSLIGGVGFKYDLETSRDLNVWAPWRSVTNLTRTITITDTNVTGATPRFYRAVSR
jgi:hypothetical protein